MARHPVRWGPGAHAAERSPGAETGPFRRLSIHPMPNIGTVLKSEISRVSRKEVRGETQALKKSISQYRTQIADLKRRMQALEQQVKRLGKATARSGAPQVESDSAAPKI